VVLAGTLHAGTADRLVAAKALAGFSVARGVERLRERSSAAGRFLKT
jgi:hypothetical protein